MAHFTSKATGNWSASGQTTWNETGVPGSGDTAIINHAITVDTNTTAGKYATGSITGASQTNPVVINSTAHGLLNGQKIWILGVSGMTQINGLVFTVANASADTFELSGVNGTGYGAWTSGGTWTLISLSINAALTVANSVALTVKGKVLQADATFTMGTGSGLVGDTTDGDVVWVLGTSTSQANCKVVITGTANSGDPTNKPTTTTGTNHASVSRTGSNKFYFNSGQDVGLGSTFNSGGWDCAYCDFTDITNSDGSVSLPLNDFGGHNYRLNYCTFDGCGTVWNIRPFGWGSATLDYVIKNCRFTNETGTLSLYAFIGSAATTGQRICHQNAFETKPPIIGNSNNPGDIGVSFQKNYAGHLIQWNGPLQDFVENVLVMQAVGSTLAPSSDISRLYMLCDTRAPDPISNPHYISAAEPDLDYGYIVFDHPVSPDGEGDPLHGSLGAATIHHCLIVPGSVNGFASGGNFVNPSTVGHDYNVSITHCTTYGLFAMLMFMEKLTYNDADFSEVKSNIAASPATTPDDHMAGFMWDGDLIFTDSVDPANLTANYVFNAFPYTDPVTSQSHPGYRGLLSSVPTGNIFDTTTGPGFVDSTRSFPTWAVSRGFASSGDTLNQKLDAGRAALLNDPTLGGDLIDWVMAGFAPTNPALKNAGHDGVTIGAIEGVFTTFNPGWANRATTTVGAAF